MNIPNDIYSTDSLKQIAATEAERAQKLAHLAKMGHPDAMESLNAAAIMAATYMTGACICERLDKLIEKRNQITPGLN